MAFVVRKSSTPAKSISSPTQISNMRDALDTKFGVLNSVQDGKIVAYDSSTNKFVLETSDSILTEAVSDNDLPDDFVRTLETEINLDTLLTEVDGGVF